MTDDDYEDEDPCDHDEYEIDCLSGRAYCDRCHHSWYASNEEIAAEQKRIEDYWEAENRANRLMWWRDLWERIRSIIPRRKRTINVDDDLPF
jgi:hypothetical protein